MHSFSHKQKLQVFVPALYALARFKTDHLIRYSVSESFRSQIYFDRVVLLASFQCLNVKVWPLKRYLKLCSVRPIYTLGSMLSDSIAAL